MWTNVKRALTALDLEERILNGSTLASLVFLFFPWLSGDIAGREPVSYSGFESYVSYLGGAILLLQLAILLMTLLPIVGAPVMIRRESRATIRLWLAIQAAVLILAALSVLTRVTYEFRGLSIRYGVYFALVCALISALYAFLQWQEERRKEVQDLFHHPEDPGHAIPAPQHDLRAPQAPPPPPPPPPLTPEEHNLRL